LYQRVNFLAHLILELAGLFSSPPAHIRSLLFGAHTPLYAIRGRQYPTSTAKAGHLLASDRQQAAA
jgi:hypothetical protein